jgi:hypothetical protein
MIWNALDPSLLLGVHWGTAGDANNNLVQTSINVNPAPSDSITHGPVGVAPGLAFHNGTTFTISPATNPTVRGEVWMTGVTQTSTTSIMAASCQYGSGRVFFLGDSSPIDDGSATPGNSNIFDGWAETADSVLIMNATLWASRREANLGVDGAAPARLTLERPRPNPSRQGSSLRFALPAAGAVRLEVLDVSGRRVWSRTESLPAGEHTWQWDGHASGGREARPGLYVARLVTPWGTRTARLARVR